MSADSTLAVGVTSTRSKSVAAKRRIPTKHTAPAALSLVSIRGMTCKEA